VTIGVFALGIELDGAGVHPAAWRRAACPPSESLGGATLLRTVRAAENAGFTFATFEDSLLPPAGQAGGRVDAVTRACFVAAATSTLGLVPVIETTYAEPFHLASQLATLDYASRGRGGWLPVRAADPATARAWGRPAVSGDDLAVEQYDAIDVARRLWDSWEDDAVIRDYATGRFLDREKLHYVDFVGTTYSVKGPAIVPRPPQGQLVVFGTDAERELADIVVIRALELPGARAAAESSPQPAVIELTVTLDTPQTSGAQRRSWLDEHQRHDSGTLEFVGAATELVELLTDVSHWAVGVRILPAVLDEDLPVLARHVLPALFAAGVAHRPVPGSTLRANLGFSRPANRFEARR
jgi:alkanesulfonate monooxygenase SsuD/methylene tetrahydromethanopterin reductase-like flavin-dependent oxidoreductase (luciferase family)